MKIEGIFEIVNEALLSIQYEDDRYEDEKVNAFELCFKQWRDVTYLEDFFETHKLDLESDFWDGIPVMDAVMQTLNEAQQFEEDILHHANKSKTDSDNSLENIIFQPLHKEDMTYIRQKSKAYGSDGGHSWLRIYAIRLDSNLYIVTGGSIKLVKSMQEREHLAIELKKLDLVAEYLKYLGIENATDYGYIEFI